ncbi:DNA adenine methylase [Agitococcus lubricus]|uniref:site-specific DNA-methyltransferase (adenine-specific) n=1 Tax=Agitococcus lubricus TaxID=1077255 RepID=A0A2T5J1K0_9GAMM|nr:DNA adenine methylase [Agitococcus lubricus]PTQ90319.1 adenine-specific DNA-methyltransferase [Agitococcus lubricus]
MFHYHKDSHAAATTQEYVFQQLIPYIGNKRRLLTMIAEAIQYTEINPRQATFLDLFAGSGVVSRMAKRMGFRVLANDWEPYSAAINQCYIACNHAPNFLDLGGYDNVIAYLNALNPVEDWVTRHLCPSHDVYFDIRVDRMFFTRFNGQRLDAMREQIEQWQQAQLITPYEQACLLAPLLFQASYTSNTSGVFKAFHQGWGGKTKTALSRILSVLELKEAVFYDNQRANQVYQLDSFILAQQLAQTNIKVDIAYLDPPYNQHAYGSNYHVLNSLTLWDKPLVSEKIQGRNKAAIRQDWRTERRSPYNYRGEAEQALAHLLSVLDAHFILASYSTEGLISLESLVSLALARGHTELLCYAHKRYRVSAVRSSAKPMIVEFVLVINTHKKHKGWSIDAFCQHIRQTEQQALAQHALLTFNEAL